LCPSSLVHGGRSSPPTPRRGLQAHDSRRSLGAHPPAAAVGPRAGAQSPIPFVRIGRRVFFVRHAPIQWVGDEMTLPR
jgi:hypothetical protein